MRWQTLAQKIGTNMKKVRRTKKWTQEYAAERAGFSLRYWQQLEAGQKNMTLRTITSIARALQLEVDELLAS